MTMQLKRQYFAHEQKSIPIQLARGYRSVGYNGLILYFIEIDAHNERKTTHQVSCM